MKRNNAQSARLYSQRKRQQERKVLDTFQNNQKRIEELENKVLELEQELQDRRNKRNMKSNVHALHRTCNRPDWFGQEF